MKSLAVLGKVDWILVLTVILLAIIGLLVFAGIYASSFEEAVGSERIRNQALWVGIGLLVLAASTVIDYRWLRRLALPMYIGTVGLLAAVLRFGVVRGGARRWITIGSQVVQPSEFAKILIIVTLAHRLARHDLEDEDKPRTWLDLLWGCIHVAIPAALVLAQPDLGTALVFGAILFGELYITGFNPWRLLAVLGTGMGAVYGAVIASVQYGIQVPFLQPYMVNRLLSFIDPAADPTGSGYHLAQSMIAIGSGRITGNGLFRADAAPLSFLPEQHTDFAFATLAEGAGFIGSSLLLVLFLVMLLRMLSAAAASEDEFGSAIVTGAVSMLFFHALVNVGMTVGLMPVTGLPLPFISYGRSAFIADMVAVGLVLNVGIRSCPDSVERLRRSYGPRL